MISILEWCYSKQEALDKSIGGWLMQKGVDFEIVVACGPDIVLPIDRRVRKIYGWPSPKMGITYNSLLAHANGDIVLITQADMQARDPFLLSKMLCHLKNKQVVSAEFYKDKGICPGIYLNCLMAERQAIIDVGGWHEAYDCPALAGHEDTDLIARLMESNYDVKILPIENEETGLRHLDHEKPDYNSEPLLSRLANGYSLYSSRHGKGVVELYVKQFARNMREKRESRMIAGGYVKG